MTKRRTKNAGPTGQNKSLGNALKNRKENTRTTASSGHGPNIQEKKVEKVLASVTHENAYEEFFNNAELAGRDFVATRGDFQLLQTGTSVVPTEDLQTKSFDELTSQFGHLLRIPRRPAADSYSTPEGLDAQEQRSFLEWRRSIAGIAEGDGVVLTPFERNLELWRQLWRVVERSDVVVQIVDARNPLLFRNVDLENYAREHNPPRESLLLINKSDLLTAEQIEIWQEAFDKMNVHVLFWSAIAAHDKEEASSSTEAVKEETPAPIKHSEHLLTDPDVLIAKLKEFAFKARPEKENVVVGMIGYPNVGKSSTINSIVGSKKTSVSATPGKTKHFQTLILDNQLTLCDCPGLVMPALGFSYGEMLLNGILPVDQMRDSVPPVQLLCTRVPRHVFESLYSIILPKPAEFEAGRAPTAHEFLTTLAFMRGFMSEAGIPDASRAARIVLKDVFGGKLKWTAAPPGFDQTEFDQYTYSDIKPATSGEGGKVLLDQLKKRNYLVNDGVVGDSVDAVFFNDNTAGAHIKGARGMPKDPNTKKHFKGKKDKLRRVHGVLDA